MMKQKDLYKKKNVTNNEQSFQTYKLFKFAMLMLLLVDF